MVPKKKRIHRKNILGTQFSMGRWLSAKCLASKGFALDCLFEDVHGDSEEKPWEREYVYVSLQSGGQVTVQYNKDSFPAGQMSGRFS